MDLKQVILDKANLKMSEDGIPDDAQPDKEMDYVAKVIADDIPLETLSEWIIGQGLCEEFLKYLLQNVGMPVDEAMAEFSIDFLFS